MKVLLLFIGLVATGGSCSNPDPLKYLDNSRVIVEGNLINEDLTPLENQEIILKSEGVIINTTISKQNGRFYLSCPKTNYQIDMLIKNKKILMSNFYNSKIKTENIISYDANNMQIITTQTYFQNLGNGYYDFGTIKTSNN